MKSKKVKARKTRKIRKGGANDENVKRCMKWVKDPANGVGYGKDDATLESDCIYMDGKANFHSGFMNMGSIKAKVKSGLYEGDEFDKDNWRSVLEKRDNPVAPAPAPTSTYTFDAKPICNTGAEDGFLKKYVLMVNNKVKGDVSEQCVPRQIKTSGGYRKTRHSRR